jgi:hypothetical protein
VKLLKAGFAFFSFMVSRDGCFVKTGKSEKVCGSCLRTRFCLSKIGAEFLNELITRHGAEAMHRWVRIGSVKAPEAAPFWILRK